MYEKEKTTVPVPSVGADGEQSLSYVTEEIVTQEPDYFQIEKNWVGSDTRYDSTSTGNAISAVEEIYKKYFIELQQTYKNI